MMGSVANIASSVSSSQQAFDQATALHAAGKFAQAEALLRDAIALDPGNVNLRNARGVMFAAMDRHLARLIRQRAPERLASVV
jgi:Flp pilus assembly protein TadD